MKKLFAFLWQIYFLLNFLYWLLILYWPLRFLFADERRWKAALDLQRFWAGWLRVFCGVKTIITYEFPLDKNATYVYAPNHTNFFDILTPYKFIPNYFHFMAKGSLAKVPLFKLMFWKTNIPFDRESSTEKSVAYNRAVSDLKKGYSIMIYPEGTQNKTKELLLPFKNGAFRMSVETNLPIVPVVTLNPFDILPHEKQLLKLKYAKGGPGKLYIIVGKPITPEECNYSPELMSEKVRTFMLEKLKEFHANRR